MFVTIGGLAQHVDDSAGGTLLALPHARKATCMEAAQCVDRYIINGDQCMHAANADFERIYGENTITAEIAAENRRAKFGNSPALAEPKISERIEVEL